MLRCRHELVHAGAAGRRLRPRRVGPAAEDDDGARRRVRQHARLRARAGRGAGSSHRAPPGRLVVQVRVIQQPRPLHGDVRALLPAVGHEADAIREAAKQQRAAARQRRERALAARHRHGGAAAVARLAPQALC